MPRHAGRGWSRSTRLRPAAPQRRGKHLADRLDKHRHLVGNEVGVALGRREHTQARPVADRFNQHQAVLHLHQCLRGRTRLEDPGGPLHQAGQPRGDGRELDGELTGNLIR